jgi:hypothetical protein
MVYRKTWLGYEKVRVDSGAATTVVQVVRGLAAVQAAEQELDRQGGEA